MTYCPGCGEVIDYSAPRDDGDVYECRHCDEMFAIVKATERGGVSGD